MGRSGGLRARQRAQGPPVPNPCAGGHADDGRAICAEAPIPWRCIVPGESEARSHKRGLRHVAGRVVSWGATLHGSAAVAMNNSCSAVGDGLVAWECSETRHCTVFLEACGKAAQPTRVLSGCSVLPTVHASCI